MKSTGFPEMKNLLLQSFMCLCCLQDVTGVYTYLGCYTDLLNSVRDLTGTALAFSNPTVDQCATQCQSGGYSYAGLQMGQNCYCGITYGLQGYSTDCNCTCGRAYCGGFHSNDIYYTVDNSLDGSRVMVFYPKPDSYLKARMTCVLGNGDMPVVSGLDDISSIMLAVGNNVSSVSKIWIGLRRRLSGQWFEWTNENAVAFDNHPTDFDSFWAPGENKSFDCVYLEVATKKWRTATCDTWLPFVCFQVPPATVAPDDSTTEQSASDSSTDPTSANNLLALYIVLPLFLLCYGGSCVIFCVYKIYRNCFRLKKNVPLLNNMEPGGSDESARDDTGYPLPQPVYVPDRPIVRTDGRGPPTKAQLGQPPSYYDKQEGIVINAIENILGTTNALPNGTTAKDKSKADPEQPVSKLDLPIRDILRMKLMKQEALKKQQQKGHAGEY